MKSYRPVQVSFRQGKSCLLALSSSCSPIPKALPNSRSNFPKCGEARGHGILSQDEFIEVFELAAPGKEFELYTENRFQRVRAE